MLKSISFHLIFLKEAAIKQNQMTDNLKTVYLWRTANDTVHQIDLKVDQYYQLISQFKFIKNLAHKIKSQFLPIIRKDVYM